VPYFWQRYRGLPAGIYITAVAEDGSADRLGITPGDILLSLDGCRVADTAALNSQLQAKKPGDSVRLILYRNGSQIPFTLILDKE
jgi:serine protease Do